MQLWKKKNYKHLFITVILLFIVFINCPDFFGLKPDRKELEEPPGPPTLFEPEDSALFYVFSLIDFIWSQLEGAEYYELRFEAKSGTTFIWQAPSTSLIHRRFPEDHYFWSARGYSSQWTDYTAWSEERFLHVAHGKNNTK